MIINSTYRPWFNEYKEKEIISFISDRIENMKRSLGGEIYLPNENVITSYLEKTATDQAGYMLSIHYWKHTKWIFEIRVNPAAIDTTDISIPKVITKITYIRLTGETDEEFDRYTFYPGDQANALDSFFLMPYQCHYFGYTFNDANQWKAAYNEPPIPDQYAERISKRVGDRSYVKRKICMQKIYEENNRIVAKHLESGVTYYGVVDQDENRYISDRRMYIMKHSPPLVTATGEVVPYKTLGHYIGMVKSINLPGELTHFIDFSDIHFTTLFKINGVSIVAHTNVHWRSAADELEDIPYYEYK